MTGSAPTLGRQLTLVLIAASLGAIAGLVHGLSEVFQQNYFDQSLIRNAFLVMARLVHRGVAVGAAVGLVIVASGLMSRLLPRKPAIRPLLFGFGSAAALAYALPRGWELNRYELRLDWLARVDLLGMSVPQALIKGSAILANVRVCLTAAAIAVAAYFVLALILRGKVLARADRLMDRLSRPLAILAALLLVAIHGMLWGVLGREPDGPNVIVISLDTLRADYLGLYGAADPVSPAVDRFAAGGVVFENAFSQAPNTLPSHASLFTSRYPSANRASMEGGKLPPWRVHCAEIFREAGYKTSAIVDCLFLTGQYGLAQGYDDFVGWGRRIRKIVPRAIRWLDRNGDDPFFLFLHIYDIHSPYAMEPEYQRMFLDFEYDGPMTTDPGDLYQIQLRAAVEQSPEPIADSRDAEYLKALYAGGVRYADDVLTTLLHYLEKSSLMENTIVVILSDHGEEFLEHNTVLHAELYRTVTHVPLIFRIPGHEGGMRIDNCVGLIDVLPTLLDLTGLESPAPLSGSSMVPLITGASEKFRPFVFAEFDDPRLGGRLSVLDDRDHLVYHVQNDRWELYSHAEDRLEQIDQIDERPARAESLKTVLSAWRADIDSEIALEMDLEVEKPELDEETVEELKALGYID